MKKYILFLGIWLFVSCSTTYKIGSEGEKYKLPKDLVVFLNSFEQSVASHNVDKLMLLMDKNYKKEQHDDMLEGKTAQFINEFFGGTDVNGSGYKNPKFKNITSIHFTSIQEIENGYTVYYFITTKEYRIDCRWDISVNKTKNGTIYGLIGAVG
ncbi:MAG: hypothetical protein GXO80_03840 [Chlorobi bacterium]|nr:hypothetical protein [Chlorobiota bacterium]